MDTVLVCPVATMAIVLLLVILMIVLFNPDGLVDIIQAWRSREK